MAFGPWSPPQPIGELASTHSDYHPAISRDGRSLYFTTDRDAPSFPAEIVVSQREDREAPWGPPVAVDALNRAGFNSGVPNLQPKGHVIYFNSNRPRGAGQATPTENIWVATRPDTTTEDWTMSAQADPNLNSGQGDGGPALSWDGTTLYFFSQRTASGKPGKRQLWMSTRERL